RSARRDGGRGRDGRHGCDGSRGLQPAPRLRRWRHPGRDAAVLIGSRIRYDPALTAPRAGEGSAMFQSHELLPGRVMGRPMHLWRYGHFGKPLLVFPTAAGFAHEWAAHDMVAALAELLDGGRLKLYCTESNVAEAWTRREQPAEQRIR